MNPTKLGERDGRDAFLLDKKIKNPFKWRTDESNAYFYAFTKAYNEEFDKQFKLDEDTIM